MNSITESKEISAYLRSFVNYSIVGEETINSLMGLSDFVFELQSSVPGIKDKVLGRKISAEDCQIMWKKTELTTREISRSCYDLTESTESVVPPEQKLYVKKPQEYQNFGYVVKDPHSKQAIAIQYSNTRQGKAFSISEGSIDILTSRKKGGSSEDIVSADENSIFILRRGTVFPEIKEEGVETYPYFKPHITYGLSKYRAEIPNAIDLKEVPIEVQKLFVKAKDYFNLTQGVLCFFATRESMDEILKEGKPEFNPFMLLMRQLQPIPAVAKKV